MVHNILRSIGSSWWVKTFDPFSTPMYRVSFESTAWRMFLTNYVQTRCGRCVTSAVDYVRLVCRRLATCWRRPQVSSAAAAADVQVDQVAGAGSSSEERKCGDGVDCACVEPPTHVAARDPAHVAADATAADDVINFCCSDDDTVTSSVHADCVTESSALTYTSSRFRCLYVSCTVYKTSITAPLY